MSSRSSCSPNAARATTRARSNDLHRRVPPQRAGGSSGGEAVHGQAAPVAAETVETRIHALDRLLSDGTITRAEYDTQRATIIKGL